MTLANGFTEFMSNALGTLWFVALIGLVAYIVGSYYPLTRFLTKIGLRDKQN